VSHTLISNVTEVVETKRKLWQNRSLDQVYPVVYLDAIVVKVRHEGRVINKAIHMALGTNLAGQKELLGLWMTQNKSFKFWLSVLTELRSRRVKDIFIAIDRFMTSQLQKCLSSDRQRLQIRAS